MLALLLLLSVLSAFLPAGEVKEVAVGAGPGEGTVADLLIGQVISGVVVGVSHDVVDGDHGAQSDHA